MPLLLLLSDFALKPDEKAATSLSSKVNFSPFFPEKNEN
jgi:hypothetical protein